jgi:predicted ATP-grasp superfamily ATP-dependent carboligase
MINRDPTLILACLRHSRQAVSIQRFVHGRPANAAVACWQGKVLAAVLVEVLCSNGATGQATVVRIVSHPGMLLAVEVIVDRLNLSGLCGFDFVLSADGSAHFLELNPRATPTCHLIAADGKALLACLYSALQGPQRSRPERTPRLGPIALFPQEMIRDPDSPFLQSAYHDIPWQSPELVKLGHALRRKLTTSIVKGLRQFLMTPASDRGDA